MDGSKERPKMTAGLDLGDKYSYLCLIETQSGEVIEEGRLRTTPEAFRRRFASEQPMRIAIEAGTHSPWVSRLLEECGHEVLVANARKLRLIYANKRKTDEIDAENLARLARLDPKLSIRSSTGAKRARPTWPSSAPGRRWSGLPHPAGQPRPRSGQVLRWPLAQVPGQELPQESARAHPRGASAGPGAHPRADRLAHRAHPRLRPKAGDGLQRALPRNGAPAPGRGDRAAHGAYLRAHLGGSLPLREEPLGRGVPGARARQRSVGG